jgi:hypothetical protein
MTTTQRFIEAAKKERYAFKEFIKETKLFNSTSWNIFISPDDGYDDYDVLIQKICGAGFRKGLVCKRYIIELKNRTHLSDYVTSQCGIEGWILEKAKYDKLKKHYDMDPERNRMLYICFTNKGTMVWDLTDLEDLNVIKKEMNKATMVSRENKINKNVILLKEENAKIYPYTFNQNDYYKFEEEDKQRKRNRIIGKKDAKQIGFTI